MISFELIEAFLPLIVSGEQTMTQSLGRPMVCSCSLVPLEQRNRQCGFHTSALLVALFSLRNYYNNHQRDDFKATSTARPRKVIFFFLSLSDYRRTRICSVSRLRENLENASKEMKFGFFSSPCRCERLLVNQNGFLLIVS